MQHGSQPARNDDDDDDDDDSQNSDGDFSTQAACYRRFLDGSNICSICLSTAVVELSSYQTTQSRTGTGAAVWISYYEKANWARSNDVKMTTQVKEHSVISHSPQR